MRRAADRLGALPTTGTTAYDSADATNPVRVTIPAPILTMM
jgi:hypothetical protein